MLPKIVVAHRQNARAEILPSLGLSENHIMAFEGGEARVVDLRGWINSAVNIARTRPDLSLIVWNADELSPECQAVLLKPMEELEDQVQLFLVTENENKLSPTILSRSVVEYFFQKKQSEEKYWSEVRRCWSSGPSACIAFVDQLDKEKAAEVVEEIIEKLKSGLSNQVNKKRLNILSGAIDCLWELKQTNINYKLALDNFLIGSWREIKG